MVCRRFSALTYLGRWCGAPIARPAMRSPRPARVLTSKAAESTRDRIRGSQRVTGPRAHADGERTYFRGY